MAIQSEIVEVKTTDDLDVQSISLPKSSSRMICRSKQGKLYVASTGEVWCLHAVPLVQQIRRVLEDKQFELALKLTNISDESQDEKTKNAYEIQTLYAHDLFEKKQFSKSMSEFLKLGTNPYNVIQLFPELVLKPGTPESPSKSPSSKLSDRDLEKALPALIEYLTEVRQMIMSKKAWSSGEVDSRKHNLIQIIDTTLLKCYLQTNDALIAPLLRLNRYYKYKIWLIFSKI